MISCAVITYGGVSLFVASFAIYPIGAALFRETDIPKRLLPPAIALGAFTFTMTAIPGTPQIQNTIPMAYFGTDTFAAPILGIIAALIIALITGIVLTVLFNRSRFEKGIVESLKEGANSSLLAIMNTASEVGYGN